MYIILDENNTVEGFSSIKINDRYIDVQDKKIQLGFVYINETFTFDVKKSRELIKNTIVRNLSNIKSNYPEDFYSVFFNCLEQAESIIFTESDNIIDIAKSILPERKITEHKDNLNKKDYFNTYGEFEKYYFSLFKIVHKILHKTKEYCYSDDEITVYDMIHQKYNDQEIHYTYLSELHDKWLSITINQVDKDAVGSGYTGEIQFLNDKFLIFFYPSICREGYKLVKELVNNIPDIDLDYEYFIIGKNSNNEIEIQVLDPYLCPDKILSEFKYDKDEWGLRELWWVIYNLDSKQKHIKLLTREPHEVSNYPIIPYNSWHNIPSVKVHLDGRIERSIFFLMRDNTKTRNGYNELVEFLKDRKDLKVVEHTDNLTSLYQFLYDNNGVITNMTTTLFGNHYSLLQKFLENYNVS